MKRIAAFVLLAYGFSWLVWLPLVLERRGLGHAPPVLHLVGALGPMVAALLVDPRAVRAGLRTRARYIALGLLAPLILFAVATLGLRAAGRPWPAATAVFATTGAFAGMSLPAYWAANLLFYGLGEEAGWRGFLLPAVGIERPLRASLVVAVVWCVWHLPLFFFVDGYMAMNAAGAAGWVASMVTGSILMTWLFRFSRGSILACAAFHGSLDVAINSPVGPELAPVMGALLTIVGSTVAFCLVRSKTAGRWTASGGTTLAPSGP